MRQWGVIVSAVGVEERVGCAYKGAFLVTDNCVLDGPLGRSLHSFARTTNSLPKTTLASLACSIHRLPHSLYSLPRGTVEIHKYVFSL